MILYQLALQGIIEYLQLNKLSEEKERRMTLMHTKPKEQYKTKLKTNKTLNLYVTILLSVISIMICLSIPFAALDKPSEIFRERKMKILYKISMFWEEYADVMDYFIVVLLIMLVYVSTRMIADAIKNTNIKISPWVEMGKYSLSPKNKNMLNAGTAIQTNIRHSNYL